METIIQSLGFKASDELEGLVREKLEKIDHMRDDVVRANVTFYLGSDGNPDNNITEIRLEIPGPDLFVKKGAASFEQSVADCVHALQTIIRKDKEKEIGRRGH